VKIKQAALMLAVQAVSALIEDWREKRRVKREAKNDG